MIAFVGHEVRYCQQTQAVRVALGSCKGMVQEGKLDGQRASYFVLF